MKKRVRSQFAGGLSGDAVSVGCGGQRAELRVEAAGVPAALDFLEILRAHVGDVEFGEVVGLGAEQLVQRAQADGEKIAQPLRLGEVAGGGAVVSDDRTSDEPVGVHAVAGQVLDNLGAEAELVERGAHARFVGECAGGRGLREQGVAACALGAECVDTRLGRAARVMDRAAAREVAYAWRGVGDGGNRCVVHGVLLCVVIRQGGCCGIVYSPWGLSTGVEYFSSSSSLDFMDGVAHSVIRKNNAEVTTTPSRPRQLSSSAFPKTNHVHNALAVVKNNVPAMSRFH